MSRNLSHALRTSVVVTSRMVASVSAPRLASSRTCSSYDSPFESAPAKIVGFVVTPTTFQSRISSSRLPLVSRSRDRSSSQIETPAPDSAARFGLLNFLTPHSVKGTACGGDDVLRREAELLEQRLVVGRGAEVLDRHDLARVADEIGR